MDADRATEDIVLETDDDITGDVGLEEFDKQAEVVEDTAPKDSADQKAAPESEPKDEHAEEQEEPASEPSAWDQERQALEQAQANYRKAQTENERLTEQIEFANTQLEQVQKQLAELSKAEDVNFDDFDETTTDPQVVRAFKSLQGQIASLATKAENLEKAKFQIETDLRAARADAVRDRNRQEVIEGVERKLSKRFGVANPSQYRNKALAAADKICQQRDSSPRDRYDAAEMLEDCYLKLVEASKNQSPSPKPKKELATDTGEGGGAGAVVKDEGKPGTLKEVVQTWKKKLKVR